MTREDFAQKIRWRFIISCFGILNVGAMLPQLWTIWKTQNTEGLSLEMFVIYLSIQIAFAVDGFFTRNPVLKYTMLASALVSVALIGSVLHLRGAL